MVIKGHVVKQAPGHESRPPDIEPASDVRFLRIVEADDPVSETEARAGEDGLSGVEVSADSCDGAGAVGRAERRERDAKVRVVDLDIGGGGEGGLSVRPSSR
jgi:hypothetical protein